MQMDRKTAALPRQDKQNAGATVAAMPEPKDEEGL
jgi:hypothetical protein